MPLSFSHVFEACASFLERASSKPKPLPATEKRVQQSSCAAHCTSKAGTKNSFVHGSGKMTSFFSEERDIAATAAITLQEVPHVAAQIADPERMVLTIRNLNAL